MRTKKSSNWDIWLQLVNIHCFVVISIAVVSLECLQPWRLDMLTAESFCGGSMLKFSWLQLRRGVTAHGGSRRRLSCLVTNKFLLSLVIVLMQCLSVLDEPSSKHTKTLHCCWNYANQQKSYYPLDIIIFWIIWCVLISQHSIFAWLVYTEKL